MSAAAPIGLANLPVPLGPGNADPGGAQIFASGGQVFSLDSQGNSWQLNSPPVGFLPADAGFLAWNLDPAACQAGAVLTAGNPALARINVRAPIVVSNVWFIVTTIASGLTASENFVGIYSSAGALLGSSAAASLDSKVTSLGVIEQALSAPVSLGPGYYWVAQLYGAGTPPVCAASKNTIAGANAGLSAATYRWCVNGTGATTLASTITPSSNALTTGAQPYWCGLS